MPFLRVEKKSSGTYLRILESYRDVDGKSKHRIVHTLGKAEDYTPEQLRSIGIKFFELGGGDINALLDGDLVELGRYNYGYQQIFGKALSHYGLPDTFRRIAKSAKLRFDLTDAVRLMLYERLQDPCSKLRSFRQQNEYVNLPGVELHHLYRALDKLADNNLLIQQQIFQTGRDLFNQALDVVFYDVTTLYFESEVEKEGALRKKGFSKDGKVGNTQILFCMLIDKDKNPIGYRIFEGDTYEGHTFEKALEDLKKQFSIQKVIVVADRGMLSKHNIELTAKQGYEFILGERLKNLPKSVQKKLLDKSAYTKEWVYTDNTDEQISIKYTTLHHEGKTIIATYSDKRAKKDKQDRDNKITTAGKLLGNPALITKKATRFYLKPQQQNSYTLNEEKIKADEAYDGILAISTNNTTLAVTDILDQYKQLFKIEHAFRTFKSHLQVRPMFHWTDKRIKGHICLCYIAFTLLNYVLQIANAKKKCFTETSLRTILDTMQVSLIEHKGQRIYLRSRPSENEARLQHQLGLTSLLPIIPANKIKL